MIPNLILCPKIQLAVFITFNDHKLDFAYKFHYVDFLEHKSDFCISVYYSGM